MITLTEFLTIKAEGASLSAPAEGEVSWKRHYCILCLSIELIVRASICRSHRPYILLSETAASGIGFHSGRYVLWAV
jgi:hypothetical protein